ncbi:MAG: dephospho-CoA kinase [Pseudanabaenaceae cyanobacterium bins.68]|nr:dephospho-CoA kinase [Pseudanabaenaceae cyanobacterium bins.68]
MGQRLIGITGGIASGKSTVASYLGKQHRLPLLDADVYSRNALYQVEAQVLARYSTQVTTYVEHQPTLDRAKLAEIIFANAPERTWLENLLHPLVRQCFESELRRLAAQPTLVLIIPLLLEVGWQDLVTETWLIYCPPDLQLKRLIQRNHLTPAAAQLRLDCQWPIERKLTLVDRVIDNSLELDPQAKNWQNLYHQVDRALLVPDGNHL